MGLDMALHLSTEYVEFWFQDTHERVVVQRRFITAVATLVQVGEAHALTAKVALKAMGVVNTETHRRQWRHAVDYWQEQGVCVAATINGYFIAAHEAERQRQVDFKQTTQDAIERRKWRIKKIPLGKGF